MIFKLVTKAAYLFLAPVQGTIFNLIRFVKNSIVHFNFQDAHKRDMPPGTNLDNVVRSISSKQIPEDSMSPVTTFEVPVSISDPPVTTCEAPVGPAPPEKRPRTWEDMAAAAGVLIMTSADNEEPNLEPVQKKKKMTPKEYRQMKPKPKTNPSITLLDKKNF